MYIIFKKSHELNGKKRPVGHIASVHQSLGKQLIDKKIAEEYFGQVPPTKKVNTGLFKPKI